MADHSIVLIVAVFASKSAAEQALSAMGRARGTGERRHVAAVVLEKGPDGALTIGRSDGVEPNVAWGGALLGAALTVLAAPVGILLLPSVVTAQDGWARAAALVAHYWENIPQEELHQMSNMLESSPAGVVIVAVDHTREQLGAFLAEATATIITESTTADLGADFMGPIDDVDTAG